MRESRLLSVVVPVYNEEDTIKLFKEEIFRVLSGHRIAYELIFVNDGSSDHSWEMIKSSSKNDDYIRGICLSRNFGKEAAIMAGLSAATGGCCVVMDCDLQHPPALLPQMYELWMQGYEMVEAIKNDRGEESIFYQGMATLFYKIISIVTGKDMRGMSDFKLLDRRIVDELNGLPERGIFFRAMSTWMGYRSTQIEFDVQKRVAGCSKWSKRQLIRYAISNICAYTAAPLQLITGLGILILIFSVVFSVYAIYKRVTGVALDGFTTLIILQLGVGSAIMIGLGIIGYYLSHIYEEVKRRPRYIIAERC